MMNVELKVVKQISKKTEKPYVALVLDLGYRRVFLNAPNGTQMLCAELLNVRPAELMDIDDGEYVVAVCEI